MKCKDQITENRKRAAFSLEEPSADPYAGGARCFEINEVNSGLRVDSSQGVQAISDTSERLRVRRDCGSSGRQWFQYLQAAGVHLAVYRCRV